MSFVPGYFWLVFLVPALIFIVLLLLVVFVWQRDEPDPRGMRPYTTYLFAVTFVSLMTGLIGIGALAGALGDRAVSAEGSCGSVSISRTEGGDFLSQGTVAQATFSIPPVPTPPRIVVRPVQPAEVPSFPSPPQLQYPSNFPTEFPTPGIEPSIAPLERVGCIDASGATILHALVVVLVAILVLIPHARMAARELHQEAT